MRFYKLPGYRFLKIIGAGGFSEVWLAEKNGKFFAVKIPKLDLQKTLSRRDLEDFLKEVEIWSKLKHKNIVKIFEYGMKPFPHIVIEYCETSLREKIGKLNLEETLKIALKIAEALEYAHLHGVVHRDIKPENILICKGEPKISDWGIAKILLKASTGSGYSGTPLYSAPEQLDPDSFGEVDWRTDIWQLGCLLYEMIEGKPPFYAEYPGQLTLKILTKPPREFKKTPKWLKQILIKCLEKRKEERWRTTSLLIEAIKYREKPVEKHVIRTELARFFTGKLDVSEIGEKLPPIERMERAVNKLERFTAKQISEVTGIDEAKTEKLLKMFAVKVNKYEWVSKYEWEKLKQMVDSITRTKFLKMEEIAKELNISENAVRLLAEEIGAKIITKTIINPKMKIKVPKGKIDIEALAIGYQTTPKLILALLKPRILEINILKTLTGHRYYGVFSVCWSPDGKYIASGGGDQTVRIWDVPAGKQIREIYAHESPVSSPVSVCWSPDGKYIASGGFNDETVGIRDVQTGKLLRIIKTNEKICSVAWSPDGKYIAIGGFLYVKYMDLEKEECMGIFAGAKTLKGHEDEVRSVAWSPDGKYIASGSNDKTVRIWDVTKGGLVRTLTGHKDSVLSVAWSPDGKYIASGSNDKTVRIWDAVLGKTMISLKGHTDLVRSVAWSPDGKYIASGSHDETVRIWDVKERELVAILTGHKDSVLSVAWSPDGKYIASGHASPAIIIWEVAYFH